jgi:hypothetical protein
MTYKFEQFNVEIADPTVLVVGVNDNINDKICSVDLKLVTDSAIFGITLHGFTYISDWSDDEVSVWAFVELGKYEV